MQQPLTDSLTLSGMAWYGGLGLAVATVALLSKVRWRAPLLPVLDSIAPPLAVGQAIGRTGCLLSGDGCYGIATDLPWGMTFPNGVVPTSIAVHPTPAYEALLCLATFGVLRWMTVRNPAPGRAFCWYLILAGIGRFSVEFLRRDPTLALGLTWAQFVSIGVALLGLLGSLFVARTAARPV
jgi:phosphatidylglycerol:prolipoprotein diacylglycerol transferase